MLYVRQSREVTYDKLADKIDNFEYDFCTQFIVVLAESNDLSVDASVLKESSSNFCSKLRRIFPNSFIIASYIENGLYNNFNRHHKKLKNIKKKKNH